MSDPSPVNVHSIDVMAVTAESVKVRLYANFATIKVGPLAIYSDHVGNLDASLNEILAIGNAIVTQAAAAIAERIAEARTERAAELEHDLAEAASEYARCGGSGAHTDEQTAALTDLAEQVQAARDDVPG